MKILIAEDDVTSRQLLVRMLAKWDYEVVVANDGVEAWDILQQEDVSLCILDWMMPGLSGLDLCRKIRQMDGEAKYIILLTSRTSPKDIVAGLDAGADDYIGKPFNKPELKARIRAGRRILTLQANLSSQVVSLKEAMAQIKTLEGILPICMYCHKIRTDKESWERMEKYMMEHTEVRFSHGLCPECKEKCLADEGLLEKQAPSC